MSNQHNIDLIRSLQSSWSAEKDPADFAALFTPNGIFEDVTYKIYVEGQDKLLAHAKRMHKHTGDLDLEILRVDATDTTGVCEWQFVHTFVGNFDGVDCTGRPVNVHGLSLYVFEDGKIAHAKDFWNYMEIVRTMEVIPKEIREYRIA